MLLNLDEYGIKARYYPALLATLPSLTALAILISEGTLGISTAVASCTIPVIVFGSADFARQRGRKIEKRIRDDMGGNPSTTIMRYSDNTLDDVSKDKYRKFYSMKIHQEVPTREQEKDDLKSGDQFYERGAAWVRENTRDTKKFRVLFSENITYGFRRNLLGLKWLGIGLNALLCLVCVILFIKGPAAYFGANGGTKVIVVVVLALIHSIYMGFFVTAENVAEAARIYARQLILSIERLK